MTRKRFDDKSTEFGLWLREQAEIASSKGFIATNIDYVWCNYKTGKWLILEEKRYNAQLKKWQQNLFEKIDKICSADPDYCGLHVLIFERTCPEDGGMWLNEKKITKEELIKFLSTCNNEEEVKDEH